MDLFKEERPFPTGTLRGWKTDSLIDRQSSAFLSVSNQNTMKCRCICTPNREAKNKMGWGLAVLSIRQADWAEVDLIRRAVRVE
ncbi:hypothetical protein B0T26DRAFT_407111 [Lasiosphaeria miniovina]|uniref:Uncharacterized protein n=1 Tax=Lasiosphaeria miniovina TaxID=1954250 RepID=A0AA40A510_9PEZI|nr:uncharacterized protein B0T26DRAFT_407111 [Lasiosphaeria miniovina]KAK0709466.1 hypothetical protein B0T26DRAFT_407111 [Lasiosphaeria miniovina]